MKKETEKKTHEIFDEQDAALKESHPTEMEYLDDTRVKLTKVIEGRVRDSGHTLLIHEIDIYNVENMTPTRSEPRYLEWDVIDETKS